MKKQTSPNFSAQSSILPAKAKAPASKARRILSGGRRYIYTEKDLGEGMLHMGITAATYLALSNSY